MIDYGGRPRRGPQVNPTTDSTLTDPQRIIADLRRELAEARVERDEALARETATSEVLGVINSSPGDLTPVFDAILEKAMRLCEAAFGVLWAYEGDRYRAAAVRGAPRAFVEFLRQPLQPHYHSGTGLERTLPGEDLIINYDMSAEESYQSADPMRRAIVDLGGARSHIAVALRKNGALLGAITVFHQEIRVFSDKQIALLRNFAAQAVIAMENARLITETREALDQQTTTAEVLQVINSSPGDLAPVFDAILEKAHALCGATFGSLQTYDGEFFHTVASRGLPDTFLELLSEPFRLGPNSFEERLVRGDELVHIPDVRPLGPLPDDPLSRTAAQTAGLRTLLLLPLRREAALVGYVASARSQVRPFTDKQIALLQNFAAQAVIAMENARLITETREALDQQTATAEVLEVINSSPGDLVPVFKTMLERGVQLCAARFGLLGLYDGDGFRGVAAVGFPPEAAEALSRLRHPPPGTTLYHVQTTHQVAQVTDISTEAAFTPVLEANPSLRGARTNLAVPMLKGSDLTGAIIVFREVVRQFTVKEIALLENFAAQAVIAVENARLVNETREALERQTATADVLGVINSSLGDLTPVFDAMLEKAMRLLRPTRDLRWRAFPYSGHPRRTPGLRRVSEEQSPRLRTRHDPRLIQGERVICTEDLKAETAYISGEPNRRALVDLGGARSALIVALTRDEAVLGFIEIYRQEVRPFSDKQIALLEDFAAQAVIAIENARLLTETREALEQQTATAEVLQVINTSPGDLAPVFDAILEKAHRLCEASCGSLQLYDGQEFRAVADRGLAEPFAALLRRGYRPDANQQRARQFDPNQVIQFDMAQAVVEAPDDPMLRSAVEHARLRSVLAVPLRRRKVSWSDCRWSP